MTAPLYDAMRVEVKSGSKRAEGSLIKRNNRCYIVPRKSLNDPDERIEVVSDTIRQFIANDWYSLATVDKMGSLFAALIDDDKAKEYLPSHIKNILKIKT